MYSPQFLLLESGNRITETLGTYPLFGALQTFQITVKGAIAPLLRLALDCNSEVCLNADKGNVPKIMLQLKPLLKGEPL